MSLFGTGFAPNSENRRPVQGRRLENPLGGGLLNDSNKREKLKAPALSRQRLNMHLMLWPWVAPKRHEYVTKPTGKKNWREACRVVAL